MEKYLYKKSYQLNSFKPIRFNDLWGKKGVFTTIRVVSPKRKFIFFASHIANMNLSLTKMNIKYTNEHSEKLKFSKPHPYGINILKRIYKIKNKNTLYFGDTVYDFKSAKNSGVNYIHVNCTKRLYNIYVNLSSLKTNKSDKIFYI